ncbi:TPA: HNH endonuclease [Citrobacter sedlakii]|nr:HNH endonuclease [Citrobacter sedlakii]HCA7134028.1 HNH endonuclease [Citrobacter sedlakii]HCA7180162.1 HNH endonuclease [Citrobacter sedlakii]
MPPRTPKACRKRGCRNTTTDRSGYCEEHRGEGWQQYKPGQNRHQRGYGTAWDKRRARIMKRDRGLCSEHLARGLVVEARHVDHIIPKSQGGTDNDTNLQCLCVECHRAKTAREGQRGGGR